MEGLRYNKGKVSLRVLSPLAQEIEARITMFGGLKYNPDNFKHFKSVEKEAMDEFLDCAMRHLQKIRRGEFFDDESLMPHAGHVIWNMGRMLDLYYYGLTHMTDGKDLYEQPYRRELPPVPTKENFEEIWGMIPNSGGKKSDKVT